jgi:hypothetical protein
MGVTVRREYSFFIVPANIVDDERVSLKGLLVYTALARRADQDGEAYPSIPAIAKAARLGTTATKEGIAELEECGYLTKTLRVREDGAQTSSLYTLVAPRGGGVARQVGPQSPGDSPPSRQASTKKIHLEEDPSEEEKNSHTPPASDPEPNPEPAPVVEVPGSEYPRALLAAWAKLGEKAYQPPNEIHFLSSTYPKSRPRFAGIHSRDVIQAIANFGEILAAPPGRYFWNQRVSFELFMDRHLERFLPANFKPDDFLKREDKSPRRWEPERAPLVETYEPIPEENLRPATEEEQAEVARMMREAAESSPAGALLGRALGLHAHRKEASA